MYYIDGIIFYKVMFVKIDDIEQKVEYVKNVVCLYNEYLECYFDDCKLILGCKVFDMFYLYGYGYSLEMLEVLQLVINEVGNEVEYILFDLFGQVLIYLY